MGITPKTDAVEIENERLKKLATARLEELETLRKVEEELLAPERHKNERRF